jgi:hypothetical protein
MPNTTKIDPDRPVRSLCGSRSSTHQQSHCLRVLCFGRSSFYTRRFKWEERNTWHWNGLRSRLL